MAKRFLSLSLAATVFAFCPLTKSLATGVTPYLPLKLSPDIERQIERVLILADMPVVRKPIAAATVLDALPKACAIDAALCANVKSYLRRYMKAGAIDLLEGSVAATTGDSEKIIPNAHGMRESSNWSAEFLAHYQVNDYVRMNLGAVAYEGQTTPTGTLLSLGWSFAQLDVGWRDHWYSPLNDSSTLISTEAPTMPSITLSNYEPFSPLGISYEVFMAEMSEQHGIAYFGSTTSGKPQLTGIMASIAPAKGYSLAVNRILQHGGGARGSGWSQFIDAIFENSNRSDAAGGEFGNQVASITSSITFPGAVPFAAHVEYSGEDNSFKGPYRLGSTNISLGIDLPKLLERYDVSLEVSEWQQAWYVHHLYPAGLTNEGIVIGHWFGDNRKFGDAVFGYSTSLAVGAQLPTGYLRARLRTINNAQYSGVGYEGGTELGVSYSTSWHDYPIEAGLDIGKDVFGESFARLSISADFVQAHLDRSVSSFSETSTDTTQYFVDMGASMSRAYRYLAVRIPVQWTAYETGYHAGIGARRRVSEHNDLGVRLELDELLGRSLVSIRALDYRYRFTDKIALAGFFGVSRYQLSLPVIGYYWGAGAQWTNLFHNWDLSLDWRHNDKLTRTKVLTTDPDYNDGFGIYIDTSSAAFYLSYRF